MIISHSHSQKFVALGREHGQCTGTSRLNRFCTFSRNRITKSEVRNSLLVCHWPLFRKSNRQTQPLKMRLNKLLAALVLSLVIELINGKEASVSFSLSHGQAARHAPSTPGEHPEAFVRGGGMIPAGWHPFGYKITSLGLQYLEFDGSLETDIGRFLASLKSQRKTFSTIKSQWLEVVRVSKTGQTMRIYRRLPDLIDFCLKARLID